MFVTLQHGDLLASQSDAVLLTADGSAPGLEGTIAREFAKRFPDAWRAIVAECHYPIGLGATEAFEVDIPASEFPPNLIVVASTLHHLESLSIAEKTAIVRSALRSGLDLARAHGAKTLGSAVLSGGWRIAPERAALEMINTFFRAKMSTALPQLQIYVLDDSLMVTLTELLESTRYLHIENGPNGELIVSSQQLPAAI